MLPQPTTATRSALLTHGVAAPVARELLADQGEHARALGGRVAVERLVLDGQRAGVAELEERVDAVGDPRAPLAVHARDVRSGLLDVLQVDVEAAGRRARGSRRPGRTPASPTSRCRPPLRASSASPIAASTSPGVRSGWFSSPKRTPCASSTAAAPARSVWTMPPRPAIRSTSSAFARRQAASTSRDRVSDAPGEGDHADAVARERVTRDRDVLGRRPAPVEVARTRGRSRRTRCP